jgi:hypothetical protein
MRKIYFGFLVLFGCFLILLPGCNLINPHENTPTYIHVDSFVFTSTPNVNISNSHSITTVYAYYNNIGIGTFDLPCTIPVMATGTGTLELLPGIIQDGLNSLVSTYPYYTSDDYSFAAQPGKIINHNPTTHYYTDIKKTTISDFAFGNTNFGMTNGNRQIVAVYNKDSLVFEGDASGEIVLQAVGDSSVDSSKIQFAIPLNQNQVYIEFNYKSSIPFYVGLGANFSSYLSTDPYYLAGIAPNDHWEKFYLQVTDFAERAQATSYTFYIKAVLGTGQTNGRLLIDNIQLVTF